LAQVKTWHRVGTVTTQTAGQICYTNGSDIVCDSSAPTLSGSMVGIGSTLPVVSLDDSQNPDAIALPGGSNAQRPTGINLANGEIRYNTSGSGQIEAYYNGAWNSLVTSATLGTATPAAGSTGYVQFNSGGYLGASSNFFWDTTNNRLGLGTATPGDTLTVNGTVGYVLGSDYTTTGSQNNVSLGTASAVRYNGAGTATFTGITAGANGQILYLHNPSAYTLTLSNLSGSSSAANQIVTGTGAALPVPSNTSVTLQYDATASLWRVTGSSNSATSLPAGSNTQVQFNNSGAFGASSNFVWDNTNGRVGIGITSPQTALQIGNGGNISIMASGDNATAGLEYISSVSNSTATGYLNFTQLGNWGSQFTAWIGRGAGGGLTQDLFKARVYDDPTGYPNQNTHVSINSLDANGVSTNAIVYVGNGSNSANTRPSLYTENGAVFAATRGNVGVGITSPKTALQAAEAAVNNALPTPGTASGVFSVLSNSAAYGMYFGVQNSNGYGWIQNMRQDGNATVYPILLQPSGGNVGIGTTSPGSPLEVYGNIALSSGANRTIFVPTISGNSGFNLTLSAGNAPSSGNYNGGSLYLTSGTSNGAGYNGTVVLNPAGTGVSEFLSSPEFRSLWGTPFTWSTTLNSAPDTDISRISAGVVGIGTGAQGSTGGTLIAGNVGIGSTSPGYLLDIYDATNVSTDMRVSNPGGYSTGYFLANAASEVWLQFGTPSNKYAGGFRYDNPSNYLAFYSNSSEHMRLDSSGNVGIGTTAPGSSLQVNGGAAVGYSTNTSAPSNGMLVNGQLGVGTTNPTSDVKADINGAAQIAGTGSEACATTADVGKMRFNPSKNYFEICSP
jgi:hypothetical protein